MLGVPSAKRQVPMRTDRGGLEHFALALRALGALLSDSHDES